MKKIITLLLVISICGLIGCGDKSVREVKIDYGNSALFSEEDMNAAIKLIKDEFSTWKGCELHSISYVSDDECNCENIAWMNEFDASKESDEPFNQCIMFKSDFHSPKNAHGEGWNDDTEYTGWHWWLARTEGDSWKLITWGY